MSWRRQIVGFVLLRWLLLLAICIFLGVYLVRHPQDWSVLERVDASAFALLCLLQAAVFVAQAAQLQLVIGTVSGMAIGTLTWQRIFWVSRLVNYFLPQSGTVYRALRLKQAFGVAFTDYAGGLILFLWLSTLITAMLALATVGLVDRGLTLYGADARLVLALLLAAVLTGPLLLVQIAAMRLPLRSRLVDRLQTRLAAAVALSRQTLTNPRFLIRYGLWTALITALGAAILVTSFAVFGARLPVGGAILMFALLGLTWLVPIVPGNLGVLELVCGVLAAGLGLALTEGLLVSALLRISGLLVMTLGGLPAGALELFGRGRALVPHGEPAVAPPPAPANPSASTPSRRRETDHGR
jgi:uncharacterized membrane protein YbhN (UPF0104 family)